MSDGTRLAHAAAEMIDVPFRLHGRDPMLGLDCIGLVAASLEAIGRPAVAPSAYRLRNSSIEPFLGFAEMSGLRLVAGKTAPGDVLLISPGPGQHHVVIAEDARTSIHAHAGLGRVVRQPIETALRPLARWRLNGSAKEE